MRFPWKKPERASSADHPRCDVHGDPLPPGAVARLGTGRLQHVVDQGNEWINALAFSADGKLLAAGAEDGRVSIWEAATGRLLHMLGRHRAEVQALAFSSVEKLLISGDREGEVWLWDAATWEKVYQVKANQVAVHALAFSPRGDLWAAAGFYGAITLWDVRRPRKVGELRNVRTDDALGEDRYNAIAFSSDGRRLAAASSYEFRAEELSPDKMGLFQQDCPDPFEMMNHPEYFLSKREEQYQQMQEAWKEQFGDNPPNMHFTIRDEGGVSRGWRVGESGRLMVWHLPDGEREVMWELEEGPAQVLTFSADGRMLAAIGAGIQVWDMERKRKVPRGQFPRHWAGGAGVSSEGRTVTAAGNECRLWEIAREQEICRLPPTAFRCLFAFSPSGDRLALVPGRDTIEIRDTATGAEVVPLTRHPCAIEGISWSAAGDQIAVTSGGTAFFWDRQSGREIGRLDRVRQPLALSPDGGKCAFVQADGSDEAQVVLWDRPAARRLGELEGLEPTALLFADVGTLVVGNKMGQIGFYDLLSRKWIRILKEPPECIRGLALSPCGRWLAAGSDDSRVRIWQRNDHKLIQEFAISVAGQGASTGDVPQRLAFSGDGSQLGWISLAGQSLVWEVGSGRLLNRFQTRRPLAALAVGCSAAGRWLAAGSTALGEGVTTYQLWVWELATGKQLLATSPTPYPIGALSFAPDGSVLASGGWERTVLLWDLGEL
jgi:WD40 repeat protein